MAKRNFRSSANDPFDDNRGKLSNSAMEADQEIFGETDIFSEMGKAEARQGRITSYDIMNLIPDPQQPRRAIPSLVRREWDGDPETIGRVFDLWLDEINAERGDDFPLEAYLLQDDAILEKHANPEPGPLETHFMQVIDLAVSIRQEGLTNPITIVANGNIYQIETGERRWLAYHLLHMMFQGQNVHFPNEREQWRKIPARVMDQRSVWRQASENNARQNLNAIGKARQFAILMMDMWANDPKNPKFFKPFHAFDNEQDYYAQVANESAPYGKNNLLLAAMGFKNRAAVTRYRDLLTLPHELWQMADDTNCPESILRKLVKLPPDIAMKHFEDWLAETTRNVASGNNSLPRNIAKPKSSYRPTLLADPTCYSGVRLFSKEKEQQISQKIRTLTNLCDGVGEAQGAAKSQIRTMVEDIRQMLDDIEDAL